MNDELNKFYELLGVAPGASVQELKTAHRDLAKVWHPDRFAQDPRLQQKAQEKLKEINEAYDCLASGKAAPRTPNHSSTNRTDAPPPARRPARWQLIPLALLVCGVVFFAAFRALNLSGKQQARSPAPPTEQAETQTDLEGRQSDAGTGATTAGVPKGKRGDQQPPREAKSGVATALEQDATKMRPLATVTLTIDPVTGMIARPDCPVKSSMTYPAGAEPHQYCKASHQTDKPATEADAVRPKQSRLKYFAKRLAAPAKLFGGKDRSGSGDKQDVKAPGGNGQNR